MIVFTGLDIHFIPEIFLAQDILVKGARDDLKAESQPITSSWFKGFKRGAS
jgi:hypothetical protein